MLPAPEVKHIDSVKMVNAAKFVILKGTEIAIVIP